VYSESAKQRPTTESSPLSLDAGFSQLTTAFLVGANVALVPRDVVRP
jgi:hypothetical protein